MNLTWNRETFLWLNHACAALPDPLWSSLTITGGAQVLFALLAPLMLMRAPQGKVVITGVFIASIVGGVVSTLLKEWFQVLRPPAVLSAEQFHLIGHKLTAVSFPSGHSLAAFTAATLLIFGLQLRGWRLIAVLVLACLVCLSRVAVGAHWPLDALGGAALGWLCGLISFRMAQSLHRQGWTHTATYAVCQAVVLGAVSASLFNLDTGYPAAMGWQYSAALFGVACSAYCFFAQLKIVFKKKRSES